MGLGHAAVAGVAQVGAADGLGDGAFDTGTLGVGGAPLGGGLGLPGAELRLPHGPGWTVILRGWLGPARVHRGRSGQGRLSRVEKGKTTRPRPSVRAALGGRGQLGGVLPAQASGAGLVVVVGPHRAQDLHLRKVVHPAGHRVGVDLVQQRAAVRADLLGQPAAEAFLRFSSREASTLRPRPRERGCDGVVDAAGDEDEQRVVQIAGGPGG